jgi:D-beta-D-heptose 7-phosphate kinase/D-beta-D-heptose 1-phosphate adenosyltransferase
MKFKNSRTKIVTLPVLLRKLESARSAGEQIVFTNGCFDLLHVGHIRCLEMARALGDQLIVAVNLDASIRRAKGPDRPINPARSRMELVAALACVDWVISFGTDTPIRLIKALKPDVLAKGGDWAAEAIVGRDMVEGLGGRVVRLPVVPGIRSTQLIEKIRKQVPRHKR